MTEWQSTVFKCPLEVRKQKQCITYKIFHMCTWGRLEFHSGSNQIRLTRITSKWPQEYLELKLLGCILPQPGANSQTESLQLWPVRKILTRTRLICHIIVVCTRLSRLRSLLITCYCMAHVTAHEVDGLRIAKDFCGCENNSLWNYKTSPTKALPSFLQGPEYASIFLR